MTKENEMIESGLTFLERIRKQLFIRSLKRNSANAIKYRDLPEKLKNDEEIISVAMDAKPERIIEEIPNGKIQEYLNPQLASKLHNFKLIELMEKSGNIELYLTPEEIRKYQLDEYDVVEMIKYTKKPEQYLNVGYLTEVGIDGNSVIELLERTKDIGAVLTPELIKIGKLDTVIHKEKIYDLICDSGQIDNFLNSDFLRSVKFSSDEIYELITKTEFKEVYLELDLTKEQIVELIRSTNEIEKYLTIDRVKSLELTTEGVVKLLKETKKLEFLNGNFVEEVGLSENEVIDVISCNFSVNDDINIIYEYQCDHTIIADTDAILKNLDFILKKENQTDKKDIIMEIYQNNNDVLKANFEILDEKYIDIFGKEKISQISCYKDVTEWVINRDEKSLRLLARCINNFSRNNETDEWTVICEKIMYNMNDYGDLINSIEQIDELSDEQINRLTYILSQEAVVLKPQSLEDVDKYDDLQIKRAKVLIKHNDAESKREAICLIKLGQSVLDIKNTIKKFGRCIESIEDEELKCYILAMKELMDLTDCETLDRIFNEVSPVQDINPIVIERMIKNEYMKLYNKGLLDIKDVVKDDSLGENIYELPCDQNGNVKDFRMIITSIAPYVSNDPSDFYEDWNRPTIASQHFCCSYIGRDMLGKAEIPHLCYGFTSMKEDSLMLSGCGDIASSGADFVSTAAGKFMARRPEEYYSPDEQLNQTERYNEMDFRRFQGEEKKQPDYIVVFRKDGKIPNIETAQKASRDFEKATGKALPIVIVDEDKCRETEEGIVIDMMEQFSIEPSEELAKSILQKIRNNGVAINGEFMHDLDLTPFKEIINQSQIGSRYTISLRDIKRIVDSIPIEEQLQFNGEFAKMYSQVIHAKCAKEEKAYEER